MELTILGYLGGYPHDGIGTSGYLLKADGYHLLLDCGSDVLLSLEHVCDPLQLDAVILSHYHHDHTADLGVLQYYWQLRPGAKKEAILPIYGHTQDPLNFAALTLPNVTQGFGYNPDETLEIGPFSITFLKTIHPVPAFAMRIVEKKTNKVLLFTSDTAYFDGLTEFSMNADLLMTDTNFDAEKTGKIAHMTSTQSGQLAHDAKVKQLLLTHLPQTIPASQLIQESQKICPGIIVKSAEKFMKISL